MVNVNWKYDPEPFAPDIKVNFPKEMAYIVRCLDVPTRCVRIIDHPVGEYVIFVKKGGENVFHGHMDSLFYEAMEKGVSFLDYDPYQETE